MQLTLGMYGDGDFFEMKGVIELMLMKLGMKKKAEYKTDVLKNYMHPGRQAQIIYDGVRIGEIGEVHPIVRKNYEIGERAIIAVIDTPEMIKFATFNRKFQGIARFPAVTRDISFVLPSNITAYEIEKILEQRGGKILESYRLFDIYEGEHIQKGFKSMAYSLVFRHPDKTMEEGEINAAMNKILNGLSTIGAELRK